MKMPTSMTNTRPTSSEACTRNLPSSTEDTARAQGDVADGARAHLAADLIEAHQGHVDGEEEEGDLEDPRHVGGSCSSSSMPRHVQAGCSATMVQSAAPPARTWCRARAAPACGRCAWPGGSRAPDHRDFFESVQGGGTLVKSSVLRPVSARGPGADSPRETGCLQAWTSVDSLPPAASGASWPGSCFGAGRMAGPHD